LHSDDLDREEELQHAFEEAIEEVIWHLLDWNVEHT
jgi:hypothetical protein